ncbi:hypothetical protein KUTeg_015217 [Tegillarca granosa]|uniref:Centaurin-gamma-1A n=1 Tax=Tegillarca granosa TaxID=220873 RepID=A0ABQ9EPG9_TEGGR|nr:hypothetical protein KUTeg_015217 [Tegillarca granosa]
MISTLKRLSLPYRRSRTDSSILPKRRSYSFVNSQEWTLSRSVPDLKLGILGSVQSGKSALVHRYLTGSYMQEESPEGGRFKKEVTIDGQSYLLLIRDEGGAPEMQFTHWVDAVIFVFSLENEMSFQTVYGYYAKMAHYRNAAEIPLILVGTQDAISESNPREIDDTRARKLASDLKRCSYYETCATYGLNVERVFQDACQKIVQTRYPSLLQSSVPTLPPSTPVHSHRSFFTPAPLSNKPYDTHSTSSQSTSSSGTLITGTPNSSTQSVAQVQPTMKEGVKEKEGKSEKSERKKEKQQQQQQQAQQQQDTSQDQEDRVDLNDITTSTPLSARKLKKSSIVQKSNSFSEKMDRYMMELQIHDNSPFTPLLTKVRSSLVLDKTTEKQDLPTPSSTPTQSRKNRRRSNLFNPKKEDDKKQPAEPVEKLGSGRVIPLKQGYLYKKSHGLNKDWKKKYVTLLDDGRLTYHGSLHDYMDDVHGKEISLVHTTVKIPGLRPRTTKTIPNYPPQHPNQDQANFNRGEVNNVTKGVNNIFTGKGSKDKESVMLTGFDIIRERHHSTPDDAVVISNSSVSQGIANGDGVFAKLGVNGTGSNLGSKIETPNVKKRHRRAKSGGLKNVDPGDDSDGYEFVIVSLENNKWHFEANNSDERDEWVQAIEQQILISLQGNESCKNKKQVSTDPAGIQTIRNVRGNNTCADCGAPNPDWASINLGTIICIECSGIHRNLGTHLTRVRSLDLDEWPPDLIRVMLSIGNYIANSVWEANTKGRSKPGPSSPRDEKEKWIRAKYETKEFLPPPPYLDIPLNQYSANVKVVDHEGRNGLWYARSSGSNECVELLVVNGCPEHPTLSRRRTSVQQQQGQQKTDVFEKLPASVI